MAQSGRAGGANRRGMIVVVASTGIRCAAAVLLITPVLVSLLFIGLPSLSQAGQIDFSRVRVRVVAADWQPPLSLPPRFRDHCRYDLNRGRIYCANHCGIDYEFYYCSPASFGCCHAGYGYCDWKGHLRCAP